MIRKGEDVRSSKGCKEKKEKKGKTKITISHVCLQSIQLQAYRDNIFQITYTAKSTNPKEK